MTDESLPDRLLSLRDYVRDEVVPAYKATGKSGLPALMLFVEPALKRADEALKSHDVAAMVRAVTELESIKL